MRKLKRTLIIALIISAVAFVAGQVYIHLIADTTPPEFKCSSDTITAHVKDNTSQLLAGVTALDNRDGDLTNRIIVSSISNLISSDTAKVTYIVFDSSNNMASLTRTIKYSDYERPKFRLEAPLVYDLGDPISLTGRLFADDVVDGDISDSIRVSSLDINSTAEGTYYIGVQVVNSMGDTSSVTLPVTLRSSTSSAPEIDLTSYLIYIKNGSSFNAADYVSRVRGASSDEISVSGAVNTHESGIYHVSYSCSNSGGTGTAVLTVVVE